MLSAKELRNGTVFEYENAPWKVLKYEHIFKGRGRGKVSVRAKNLKDGSVREMSFQSSENVKEAEVERIKITYLYRTREEAVFDKQGEKLFMPVQAVEWELNFLKKQQEVWVLFYHDEPIGIQLPPTVELSIKSTDPGVKGDTVSNTLKPAVLTTGFTTKVPLFIGLGERVSVDTETGEYRGRAST